MNSVAVIAVTLFLWVFGTEAPTFFLYRKKEGKEKLSSAYTFRCAERLLH